MKRKEKEEKYDKKVKRNHEETEEKCVVGCAEEAFKSG